MTKYLIEKDVYFCYAGSQVVFLDLKRNKYLAIDRQQATALNGIVLGWDAPEPSTEDVEDEMVRKRMRMRATEKLVELGILTESLENGKNATPTRADRPTADLFVEYESNTPSIRLLHVIRFIKSYLYAAVSLRFSSLSRIVHRIEARKRQVDHQRRCECVDEARELVSVYTHLRPFVFRASDRCLLDSLVLVEFLRHYNVYPMWVIGVSTNPFFAHSWLEINRVVVNDRAMRVNVYIPIMAQ